ncbi:sepiapterin reductase a isoform X2 [Echeneis naucrates]|uniref:sepiapterin reductase a isoform X2 n=1 Tax=Echeneis naucrates TaxID=173247 RepID=UPI0011132D9C|nr:sepiapterin reductase isoform X2 [Echeneis naucrates]
MSIECTDLGQALCIVTGASRGFGRAVAREMSQLMKPRSVIVLVARTEDDLRSLQKELAESEEGRAGLVAKCVVADLGQTEGVESVVGVSKESFSDDMDHIILVNNAASLGDVSRYAISFTNMAEPFSSWVLYCTGKAARDMIFRVLAEEEPDLRVLNYSPGPLDTDMYMVARTRSADPGVRKSFSDMIDQGQVLTCEKSCKKLMKLLLDDKYTSGDHIDIYDV